jgi:DNA-binding PadR family transcriptional regulator
MGYTRSDGVSESLTSIRIPIYRFPNMKPDYSHLLPLSPPTLHVLLALTGGDLHGYGIMLEVARQSAGQYKIGPGTLYDNIKKLLKLGLVDECPPDDSESEPRRKYRLTQIGSSVLAAETERLAAVLREARRGLRLHEERQ